MLLANLKVELKLRWMNHCALATVSLDEANASSNNIILYQNQWVGHRSFFIDGNVIIVDNTFLVNNNFKL